MKTISFNFWIKETNRNLNKQIDYKQNQVWFQWLVMISSFAKHNNPGAGHHVYAPKQTLHFKQNLICTYLKQLMVQFFPFALIFCPHYNKIFTSIKLTAKWMNTRKELALTKKNSRTSFFKLQPQFLSNQSNKQQQRFSSAL